MHMLQSPGSSIELTKKKSKTVASLDDQEERANCILHTICILLLLCYKMSQASFIHNTMRKKGVTMMVHVLFSIKVTR